MSKGKLIVLEGIDGSGKSAQYRRLCARMEKQNIDYNHIAVSYTHLTLPTKA